MGANRRRPLGGPRRRRARLRRLRSGPHRHAVLHVHALAGAGRAARRPRPAARSGTHAPLASPRLGMAPSCAVATAVATAGVGRRRRVGDGAHRRPVEPRRRATGLRCRGAQPRVPGGPRHVAGRPPAAGGGGLPGWSGRLPARRPGGRPRGRPRVAATCRDRGRRGACRRRGARGPQVARRLARLLPGRAGGSRGRRCGTRVPPFPARPVVRHVPDAGRRRRAGDVPAQPRRRPPARAGRGRRCARRRDVRRHAAGGGGGLRPVPARGAARPGGERRPRQLPALRGAGRRRHVVSQRHRGGRDDPVCAARDTDRHVSVARPTAGVRRPSGEPVHAAGQPVSAARRGAAVRALPGIAVPGRACPGRLARGRRERPRRRVSDRRAAGRADRPVAARGSELERLPGQRHVPEPLAGGAGRRPAADGHALHRVDHRRRSDAALHARAAPARAVAVPAHGAAVHGPAAERRPSGRQVGRRSVGRRRQPPAVPASAGLRRHAARPSGGAPARGRRLRRRADRRHRGPRRQPAARRVVPATDAALVRGHRGGAAVREAAGAARGRCGGSQRRGDRHTADAGGRARRRAAVGRRRRGRARSGARCRGPPR